VEIDGVIVVAVVVFVREEEEETVDTCGSEVVRPSSRDAIAPMGGLKKHFLSPRTSFRVSSNPDCAKVDRQEEEEKREPSIPAKKSFTSFVMRNQIKISSVPFPSSQEEEEERRTKEKKWSTSRGKMTAAVQAAVGLRLRLLLLLPRRRSLPDPPEGWRGKSGPCLTPTGCVQMQFGSSIER